MGEDDPGPRRSVSQRDDPRLARTVSQLAVFVSRAGAILDGHTTLAFYIVNNATGVIVSSHNNIVASDRVVGRQVSGVKRYYHTDMLGSTRAVVEYGVIVESYDYDPWGVLLQGRTLAGPTKEGFTGKERDAETGLDYFGFRYYMPALGRWTTVDPPADSFPSWSPYNYVYDNPVSYTDPFGLAACDEPPCPWRVYFRNFWAGFTAMPGDQPTGFGWHTGGKANLLLGGLGKGTGLMARDAAGVARTAGALDDAAQSALANSSRLAEGVQVTDDVLQGHILPTHGAGTSIPGKSRCQFSKCRDTLKG